MDILTAYLGATVGPHAPTIDDRTLAIVSVAYADRYLGLVIQKLLPGLNSDLRSKMFNAEGVLGPVGAKIDFARALGVIDADLRHDLIIMARIRNRFAHQLQIYSFDHPEIADQIDKIRWRIKMIDSPEEAAKADKLWAERFTQWPARVKFRNMALMILTGIGNAAL